MLRIDDLENKSVLVTGASAGIVSHGDEGTLPDHFDPAVLICFLERVNRFEAIYEEYADK